MHGISPELFVIGLHVNRRHLMCFLPMIDVSLLHIGGGWGRHCWPMSYSKKLNCSNRAVTYSNKKSWFTSLKLEVIMYFCLHITQ